MSSYQLLSVSNASVCLPLGNPTLSGLPLKLHDYSWWCARTLFRRRSSAAHIRSDMSGPIFGIAVGGPTEPIATGLVGCDTLIVAPNPSPLPSSEQAGSCTENDTTACLNGGRFSVQVFGEDESIFRVTATEDDAAIFVDGESVGRIRVLNGCAMNGHFLVFGDGFESDDVSSWSRVEVTDTVVDETIEYVNALGTTTQSIQDVSAFSTCE